MKHFSCLQGSALVPFSFKLKLLVNVLKTRAHPGVMVRRAYAFWTWGLWLKQVGYSHTKLGPRGSVPLPGTLANTLVLSTLILTAMGYSSQATILCMIPVPNCLLIWILPLFPQQLLWRWHEAPWNLHSDLRASFPLPLWRPGPSFTLHYPWGVFTII